jgi:hypothetical protein
MGFGSVFDRAASLFIGPEKHMAASALTFRAFLTRLGPLALASLALSGCQSIQGTSPTSPEVRLVDAQASGGGVQGLDFYLNNSVEAYNLGPVTFTNYIPIKTGSYTASVATTQTTQILASTGFTAATNQHYTVVAGNIPAQLELKAFADQSGPAPNGQIDIRFLDQSQNNGAVDIYLVPQGGKLITTNPVMTGLTFDTNTGYISVPAGTYQMAIVPTGTIPISTTVTLATGPLTTYAAGDAVTFLLTDNTFVTTPTLTISPLKPYDFGNDF